MIGKCLYDESEELYPTQLEAEEAIAKQHLASNVSAMDTYGELVRMKVALQDVQKQLTKHCEYAAIHCPGRFNIGKAAEEFAKIAVGMTD